MKKETIVISVGGSIIVPDDLDVKFLKGFRELIVKNCKKYRFIIIIGGGKTARKYQKACKPFPNLNNNDLDWIGIHATWLNADFVRTILKDIAYKEIIDNPNTKVKFDKVLVAGGWKPGRSTDYDAVVLAKNLGSKTVINMTNVDYLYDKNPKEYKNAKKIEKIDWKGFRKIVGYKWIPGLNVPFDPIAARLAQKSSMKLILLGKNLTNLKNFLDGKKFKGSIVK